MPEHSDRKSVRLRYLSVAGYGEINAVGDLCCHAMMSQCGYQAHYCIWGTNRHGDPVWIGQMWCIGKAIESPANTLKLPLVTQLVKRTRVYPQPDCVLRPEHSPALAKSLPC